MGDTADRVQRAIAAHQEISVRWGEAITLAAISFAEANPEMPVDRCRLLAEGVVRTTHPTLIVELYAAALESDRAKADEYSEHMDRWSGGQSRSAAAVEAIGAALEVTDE